MRDAPGSKLMYNTPTIRGLTCHVSLAEVGMDREMEERVLKRAVEKGLIRSDGLALFEKMLIRYGPRLGALIGVNRLDVDAVKEIIQELEAAPEGIDPAATTMPIPRVVPQEPVTLPEVPLVGHTGQWSGQQCGRYEIGELLGQGGMGEVYRATDTMLKRSAAVKFLHGEDPRMVARFLQEARLQARVEHEHVCKVYEAGDFDGHPYIVMQLVEGETLSQAGGHMELAQKARVMMQVSEAVNAANKLGLIHRDLKPTNIMVEKGEDGDWKPIVMDFGLARDIEGPGTTTTGQAVGTPSYMAPEQAQGLKDHMDRRTDVYGLGATLYHLLSNRPPFEGASGIEVMMKVIEEEPVPLRRLDPCLPADLETIVMKCLEKEPARRYESAHLLADELRRFLEGEPISARRASWSYRTMKRARKHKAIVIVSVAAIIAVAVLGAIGLHARWTAAERARLAQQFGQDVQKINSIMQTAYLQPLHDTRPSKARVRMSMTHVEEEQKSMGALAEAPADYALGCGDMALGNYRAARGHLEAAWNRGMNGPDAASALGLTYGALYKDELDAVKKIQNAERREKQKRQIEKEYRTPAISYLRNGKGMGSLPIEYIEGFIAYFEHNDGDAIDKAQAAFEHDPSLYGAKILEGDALVSVADEKRNHGEDEAAMAEYRLGINAYHAATLIARSDPLCYLRLSSLWTNVMEMDLYGKGGGDLTAHLAEARTAAESALIADPERPESHATLASVYWLWGQYQIGRGEDPTRVLTIAADAASEAVRLRPDIIRPYLQLAAARHLQAEYDRSMGKDSRPMLTSAIENYKKVIEMEPASPEANENLGLAYENIGDDEAAHGQDPRNSFGESIRYLKKAVELSANDAETFSNLGTAYLGSAEYELTHGGDPLDLLAQAAGCYEKSASINPSLAIGTINLGVNYEDQGLFEWLNGKDPRPSFEKAIDTYQKAIATNAGIAIAHSNLGRVYRGLGEYACQTHGDPEVPFKLAEKSFAKALQIDPRNSTILVENALISIDRAGIELNAVRPPDQHLAAARRLLIKAIAADPATSTARMQMGIADTIAARWLALKKKKSDETFTRAKASLGKAVESNPGDAQIYLAFASFYRYQASARSEGKSSQEISNGLDMAAKSLSINPKLAEAVAEQGALYLEQARAERSPTKRIGSAQQALDALERALTMNPLLRKDFQPLLAAARGLGGKGSRKK